MTREKSKKLGSEIQSVACKLVDFGESRAALKHTGTMCHTGTTNVDRGTAVYMAPEFTGVARFRGQLSSFSVRKD